MRELVRAHQHRALTHRLRMSDHAIARATRSAARASRKVGRAALSRSAPLARRGGHVGCAHLDLRLADIALELARERLVGQHLLQKVHNLGKPQRAQGRPSPTLSYYETIYELYPSPAPRRAPPSGRVHVARRAVGSSRELASERSR